MTDRFDVIPIGVEDEAGRSAVLLDGRPRGVWSLGETRIVPDRPTLLRHVADVGIGTGREEIVFRVNGQPTVAMVVFQEEGANLIRLGRGLRAKLDELSKEFEDYGIEFVINFDAAQLVDEQLQRLRELALYGFGMALLVLFLFLRQLRAVMVVAVAVPASLLTALSACPLARISILSERTEMMALSPLLSKAGRSGAGASARIVPPGTSMDWPSFPRAAKTP